RRPAPPTAPPTPFRRSTTRRSRWFRHAPSAMPRSVPPAAANPVTSRLSLSCGANLPRSAHLKASVWIMSGSTNTLLTLHDPDAAARYYAEGLWRSDTLYTLLQQHAAERPADSALRDGARRLTWGELLVAVDAVAADLDTAGLKRGERVAVW